MIDYEELAEAMGDLDEDTVKELLETVMADGGSGAQQAMDACQKGMDIVGSRFESGEYIRWRPDLRGRADDRRRIHSEGRAGHRRRRRH